jgi:hypothetical protein
MIYIAKFLHATNQQEKEEAERRHGEFNLIVEAGGKEDALERFRGRIIEFRESTDLFEGDCLIYMVHLLELTEFPQDKPKMLYYKSVAGDPIMPYISCTNPSGDAEGCRILNWQDNRPELDGRNAEVFMEFEG